MTSPATSEETRQFFDQWGYVRVPGAFDYADTVKMQAWLWERMGAIHGARENDPATWTCPYPASKITEKKFGLSPAHMATPAFRAAADAVLGPHTWELRKEWSGALVSFPKTGDAAQTPWTVVTDGWHWDTDVMAHISGPQGLFIFTVCGDLEPQGGGTLLLAGSHHLLNRFFARMTPEERAAGMKKQRTEFQKSSAYLSALTGNAPFDGDRVSRFMGTVENDEGVNVQVVEVMGKPGDAFLCHPSLLHAVSPNRRKVPRLMRITGTRKIREAE